MKTLYLLRGFSPDGARPVIFHELIHALEDQYFDLDARLEAVCLKMMAAPHLSMLLQNHTIRK